MIDSRTTAPGSTSLLGQMRTFALTVEPAPITTSLPRYLHLDAALHAVEVRLHVRRMAADVLPVTCGGPAVDTFALFQKLREHIARPIGHLPCAEEIEHRGVEDVDARVGQVRDDLAP